MIITSGRFATQPQYNALINPEWLERGLVVACNPAVGAYNQVTRQNVTNSGSMATTPTNTGKSWQGAASKYIDFGSGYDPGTSGMTVLQVINPGSVVNLFPFSSRSGAGTAGIEVLIGNASSAGAARFRMHNPEVSTADLTGLNDNKDHVLVARFTPSVEIKIWADSLGKSSANITSIPASTTSTQNLRLHSRATTYYTGKSGLFLYFDNPLSNDDVGTLLQNPSVIYEAPATKIWVLSSAPSGDGVGSASGESTVSGVGASDNAQPGSASGTSTVSGVGSSTAESIASSSGSSTVSGVGSAVIESVGTASGTSTADGVGTSGTGSSGSASGTSSVSGAGASVAASEGVSEGVALASGVGGSVAASTGTSSGTSTVSGVGDSTQAGSSVGSASGTSTASGVGASVVAAVGSASGSSTVTGKSGSTGGVVESFSGGYPYISRESHAERKKKQRIKLGIIEEETPGLVPDLEQFEISNLVEKRPGVVPAQKPLIPARQLKKLAEQEEINAELKQLLQLEQEREEEAIVRMLMEL